MTNTKETCKCVLYLCEDITTVPIKGEFLFIKSDIMSFSIYGTGTITCMISAFPFSAFAGAIMQKGALISEHIHDPNSLVLFQVTTTKN